MSVDASIACREVVEILNDYLEGELPEAERVRVEDHLGGCEGCTTILDEFRETQRATLLDAFRGWTASG